MKASRLLKVALAFLGLAAYLALLFQAYELGIEQGTKRKRAYHRVPASEPPPEQPDPYLSMLDRLFQRELMLQQITLDEADFQEREP